MTSALPGKLPRVRPIAASVPKPIANRVAAGATIMLFFSARIHSAELKKSWYHCNEKPCSG
ncbi:hypothetical protein ALP29_201238 [Pseudomonas syringae pv. avii]|uniref:Uncharacterized protein n=1 Tax=Pseudomonas syringae pv. avii TaxID=663959 RepID=A0A3M5UBE7_PSESX|nr:hypothetical protein ALP29_201238 [Pseudomonas syringae pv. avii]